MGNFVLKNGITVPSHSVSERINLQNNGIVLTQAAYYVFSGSVQSVQGGNTAIVEENIDTYGFALKRVEVFHSGAAAQFDFSITNTSGSTDPLDVIAEYSNIDGSDDFSGGIDQVEQLVGLAGSAGSIFLNFSPNVAGNNDFKYLIFVEPCSILINKDKSL